MPSTISPISRVRGLSQIAMRSRNVTGSASPCSSASAASVGIQRTTTQRPDDQQDADDAEVQGDVDAGEGGRRADGGAGDRAEAPARVEPRHDVAAVGALGRRRPTTFIADVADAAGEAVQREAEDGRRAKLLSTVAPSPTTSSATPHRPGRAGSTAALAEPVHEVAGEDHADDRADRDAEDEQADLGDRDLQVVADARDAADPGGSPEAVEGEDHEDRVAPRLRVDGTGRGHGHRLRLIPHDTDRRRDESRSSRYSQSCERSVSSRLMTTVIEVARPRQDLRPHPRPRRARPQRGRRRGARLPRAERRRQIDHHPGAARDAAAAKRDAPASSGATRGATPSRSTATSPTCRAT